MKTKWQHLNLGYNNLYELPGEACAAMPNLEELLLPSNMLEWLPKELAGLKLLKLLDVSCNPLTSPPVEVAARGLDSVKRYFRDVESKSRFEDQSAEERQVEVPNQVKVIFIGHSEAGKSQVIECLVSTKHQDVGIGGSGGGRGGTAGPFLTPSKASGGSSTSGRHTPASSSTPIYYQSTAASTPPQHHQHHRRLGAPPPTPQAAPTPPVQDNEGWQVVGAAKQRSAPATSTPASTSNSKASQERYSGPPAYGVATPGPSPSTGGRRWETAVQGGGDGAAGEIGGGSLSSHGGARHVSERGSSVRARRMCITRPSSWMARPCFVYSMCAIGG